MPDVPFPDLVRGFLMAAREHHYETTVVAVPRNQGPAVVSSNNGETGIGKARAQLLVQDGAIERTAMALHQFRFVEEGKTLDADMDACSFAACMGAGERQPDGTMVMASQLPWDKLPDVLKEAHRTMAKVLIGSALTGGGEAPGKKILV